MAKTIFNLLNSILYKRGKKLTAEDLEEVDNFSPFMLNNWISLYGDGVFVDFINQTANRDVHCMRNNEMVYNYYYHTIPIVKFQRMKYFNIIKKEKDPENEITDEMKENIKYFAKRLEISEKEVKYLLERNLLNIK